MIKTIGTVGVRNLPPKHSRYVMCRLVDGELWFYTSWNTRDKAEDAAREFENGIVVDMESDYPDMPDQYDNMTGSMNLR